MTDIRVTTVGADVLYKTDPHLRVTTVGADVLYQTDPYLRVTTVGVDVLWKGTEGVPAGQTFRAWIIE